jgi:hypothetical protein
MTSNTRPSIMDHNGLRQESVWDAEDVSLLLSRGLIARAEHAPSVGPSVEARPVAEILPALGLQLHRSTDLLKLPGDVDDPNHGDDEEDEGLEDNVEGQHGVPLHHPGGAPPFGGGVGGVQQAQEPEAQDHLVTYHA